MASFLTQLSASVVTIDGATYPLGDYPSSYLDYLIRISDEEVHLVQYNAQAMGFTPDDAPTEFTEITDVSTTLLAGRIPFVVRVGTITDTFVHTFDDGTVLFDHDPQHIAGRAAAWCRSNLPDDGWAIDVGGFESDDAPALVWFLFSRIADKDAFKAAFPGAGA